MRAALAIAIALLAAGPAAANAFVVRAAGAATAIAVDQDSIRTAGGYRTGWTYELYRERNPLFGKRTQIMGVLELVDCKTLLARRLEVVHYLDTGDMLSRTGPERAWSESLRGSNTDLLLRAICYGPDEIWARRRAATVFDLYGEIWR